jgi:hypothetical protein
MIWKFRLLHTILHGFLCQHFQPAHLCWYCGDIQCLGMPCLVSGLSGQPGVQLRLDITTTELLNGISQGGGLVSERQIRVYHVTVYVSLKQFSQAENEPCLVIIESFIWRRWGQRRGSWDISWWSSRGQPTHQKFRRALVFNSAYYLSLNRIGLLLCFLLLPQEMAASICSTYQTQRWLMRPICSWLHADTFLKGFSPHEAHVHDSFFGWIMPTLKTSEYTILQIVGLDAAVVSAFLLQDAIHKPYFA